MMSFEYDAGGNLTAWGASTGWQYLHNRLTEVPSKGYEFYYTANGERAAWFQTPTMPDGSGYRLRADANGDDCVDDADLGIVLEFYGCEAPWTGNCTGGQAADLNEDGLVDDTDLAWVSEDYGAFAWLYEYDVYGNLIYAGSPCVGEYEAAYDAFGRRVWERIDPAGGDPVETHFVYDGDALALELSPNGTPLAQYVWGLLGPIARIDLQTPSNTRYYVLDARGHARAMVDSTGSVTDYYEYNAWGNLSPGSFGTTPNPFKWNAAAGYQHIPFTGLYHVGAREYDPRTARWLQRDPIGQSSGDPNLYRYCGNDAVNLNDPSGLAFGPGGPKRVTRIIILAFIPTEKINLPMTGAFSGDNRPPGYFSDKYRLKVQLLVEKKANALPTMSIEGCKAGETHRLDSQGSVVATGRAVLRVTFDPPSFQGKGTTAVANLLISASNPLVAGSPPISLKLRLHISSSGDVVSISGDHTAYPSFELWRIVDGEASYVYFYNALKAKTTAVSLIDGRTVNIKTNFNGSFDPTTGIWYDVRPDVIEKQP